jgi:two-component system, OmpR family, alkaline phosphatase synthesis response regulator PhoP
MAQRILVVDDDRQIVRLVQSYLEQAGYLVLTAYDGETALRLIRTQRPDLVVLDLMLPHRDGWEITRLVRATPQLTTLPILVLTARIDDADKIVGLELGADDYVTKPFNPREVLARVHAVLRRANGGPSPLTVLESGPIRMDPDRHEARLNGQLIELTPTEFELLKALLEQPGHAYTRRELIDRALGDGYESLERTLDSHIKNLRKKLETDADAPSCIHTVFGVGYRLQSPATENAVLASREASP